MAKKRQRVAGPRQSMSIPDQLRDAARSLAETEELRRAGKCTAARRACEALLKHYPDHAGAYYSLGLVNLELKDYDRAYEALSRANDLTPGKASTLAHLGRAQAHLGMFRIAIRNLRAALERDPDNATARQSLVSALVQENEFEDALLLAREGLQSSRDSYDATLQYLELCRLMGRHEDAAAVCARALEQFPPTIDLLFETCELPVPLQPEISEAKFEKVTQSGSATDPKVARIQFSKCHRDGDYAAAWKWLQKGHEADRGPAMDFWRGGAQERSRILEDLRRSPLHEGRAADATDHPISLFILGASRSGKSSLENLLAAEERVVRGHESLIVKRAMTDATSYAGHIGVPSLLYLPRDFEADFRARYFDELRSKLGEASVFTNTMPAILPSMYRMALTIPNCKIIFMTRDRTDLTFDIYRKHYAPYQFNAYAFDLDTINEHLDWYDEVASVLAQKLPGQCLNVDYAQMVTAPRETLDRVQSFVGISQSPAAPSNVGDGRGVSAPYADFLERAISSP